MCGDMKAFERLNGESLLELEASLGLLPGQPSAASVAAAGLSTASGQKTSAATGPKLTSSGRRSRDGIVSI